MKIHVGPACSPELEQAVCDGGGELAPASEASAAVFFGAGPERFGEVDHPGLEWVQLPAAGVESWVDSGALRDGVTFTSAAGCYGDTVAEHALALMLAGARKLQVQARADSWARPEGIGSLFGSTVGIIGAGGIGRALIRLLEPFGGRVLAVNRSGRPVEGAARTSSADDPAALGALLSTSDFVVVAAPSTCATSELIDDEALALMQPHAWLVNVARGSLVDTDALLRALREQRIGGAALDVTDPEPLPDRHPLFREQRALVSPHCANPPDLLVPALARRVRENVRRWIAGEPLLAVIDPAAGY